MFLSPIFNTTSHKDSRPIGLLKLAKIISKQINIGYFINKVYILGGINTENLKKIQNTSFLSSKIQGFGAIDYFKSVLK